MSEMVVRVRDAITRAGPAPDAMARAAIKAMREPTLDMCAACEDAMKKYIRKQPAEFRRKHHYFPRGYMVPQAIKIKLRYQAMIDEALK